jgi:hypothetical protein
MAMNTSTRGEKTSLRIWLRIFKSAVTQRKLNKRIMALPKRYGSRAAEVSMVTLWYHRRSSSIRRCPEGFSYRARAWYSSLGFGKSSN